MNALNKHLTPCKSEIVADYAAEWTHREWIDEDNIDWDISLKTHRYPTLKIIFF
jgi:hypothetical protein